MAKANVFIVEDESIVVLDLKSSLENIGYSVIGFCDSGEEAIKKIPDKKPDLVLMDIGLLGVIDGIQAADIIRQKSDIPVIYLTANSDEKTLQRAKVTDPFGYILKPFDQKELMTAIEMALYKHKAESKLKASEKWLSTTLKSIGDAVIATDVDSKITFLNSIAEKLTGYKLSEALGQPLEKVFNIINENTRQVTENPVAKVIRDGKIVGLANHTILISKDGQETPIDDSASPIRDDNNNITGVVLVFRDITDRKQANQKLTQSEQNARNLIELFPYGILIHRNGVAIYCNSAALRIFGADSKNEILGKPVLDFMHPDSKELAAERVRLMTIANIPVPLVEEKIIKKDGSVIDVEISAGPFLYEGEPAIQTVIRDISERKENLEALKRSEARYKATFENTGTATHIVREDTIITLVNSEYEKLSGYSREEIESKKSWTEFVATEDLERVLQYHQHKSADASDVPGNYEFRFVDKWGNVKNVINTVVPIPGTTKRIVSLLDITERKKVEEALKASQRKTQAIINAIPDLLFVINKKGIFTDVKYDGRTRLIHSSEKIIGKHVSDLLPGKVADETLEKLNLALKTKQVQIFEYELELDNELHYYEARLIAGDDDEVLAIIRDITETVRAKEERRLSEEAVRKSDMLFRLVWENSADGMRIADAKGIIRMVNDSFCTMTGNTKDELLGKPISCIIDKSRQEYVLRRYVEKFRTHSFETRIQQELNLWDGRTLWSEVSNAYLELDGQEPLLVSIFRDITRRIVSEKRLTNLNKCFLSFGPDAKENIGKLVSFIGNELNADSAIYNHIEGDRLMAVAEWNFNGSFCSRFQENGSNCYDLLNDKFTGLCVNEAVQNSRTPELISNKTGFILKTNICKSVTVENRTIGSLCILFSTENPLGEDENNLLGIAASAIGVEEKRQQADDELRMAKETAEKADKLKTDFLAQMSHEIRTPINTILSFTSLLKEELESKLQEDLAVSFKIIDNGGRRLTRTIDMILTMSQLQSGNYEINPVRLNLYSDILELLYKEFLNVASTKGLELLLNLQDEATIIFGDHYTLSQLFQNLIDNSIKYTKQGRVEIVIYSSNSGELSVDIRDTGIGISEVYLPNLFSPFTQEETGYTRRFDGNGLGLALVKKYAELNNASIQVQSKKGQGTTFTVTFKKMDS